MDEGEGHRRLGVCGPQLHSAAPHGADHNTAMIGSNYYHGVWPTLENSKPTAWKSFAKVG